MARTPIRNDGKTVAQILATKKGSVKNAPLPPGFPGWDRVADLHWEEVVERARRNDAGFRELRKLLSDKRFDR